MKMPMNLLKRRSGISFLMLFVTGVSFILMVFAGYMYYRAKDVGAAAGSTTGKLVGTAIGSFDGLFNGLREGEEAGAEAGLSAEDSTVNIQDGMKEIGNLDVLAAGVTLKNINRIGEDYARLSLINGDAVFSVDMAQAEISFSQDGQEVYIVIPEPTLALYLDQSGTETLAEIQGSSLGVSAEDGLIAYLNSMAQTVDETKEALANYDSLMEHAKESARKQIQQLAEMLCGDKYTVYARFR